MSEDYSKLEILKFSKNSMILAGIWRLPITQNPTIKRLYVYYSVFIQAYFPFFLIFLGSKFFILAFDVDNSPLKVFSTFAYMITSFVVMVKVVLVQKKRVRDIFAFINRTEEEIKKANDIDILKCHSALTRFCRKSNWATFFFTFGIGVAMIFANIVQRHEISQYNKKYNTTIPKPFPYELYYMTLDEEKYGTLFVWFNDFSILVAGFLVVSTQVIFISCIIFASSLLRMLQIRFKKMIGFTVNISVTLRELILEHQRVIEFVNNLNESMKYIMMLEYLLNSLNMAMVSFQFLAAEHNILIASVLFYFGLLVVQTFILGWSANEVKMQSLALADAIYESPWYEQNHAAKKTMIIMMMRAQRPLALTIGPFDVMTTQSALTESA
ncbi:odorant receptor Or2-like [Cylas formicarius]|uniref:odorant receptor Or2-like n=1 Tax=Cylas formicarius TaxID=197179 RepID=UPI00295853C9|nr:odorant receptor Or2-like [Cylas formicarius]